MKLPFALLFSLSVLAQTSRPPEKSIDEVIKNLQVQPSDIRLINDLAKHPKDPRVIPLLRELFTQAKMSGATQSLGVFSIPIASEIAFTLIRLGVADDMYFNEVAEYARTTITLDQPAPFLTDAKGKEDPVRRNPSFENWCSLRGLEWDQCMLRMTAGARAVDELSAIRDKRSTNILRQALGASNHVIVLVAVDGLARLNDIESIPAIAGACARFPPDLAQRIAMSATEFADSQVQSLFERFIKDPELLADTQKVWRQKHDKQQ
jgi:hypothetical protein